MKICNNCGAKQGDDAVFCPMCGRAFPIEAKKESRMALVLGFLNKIAAIISACFAFSAIIEAYIDVDVNYGYGSDNTAYIINTSFIPNHETMLIAHVFGLIALGVAIVNLILTLIKNRNIKAVFSSIVWVVLSTGLTTFGAMVIF